MQLKRELFYGYIVRPGAVRLLTGEECSRVRDSAWMHLISFVTTRIEVGLVDIQGNYLKGMR